MRSRVPLLLLVPAVLAASFRARRLFRGLPLDQACRALSEVRPLPLALRDPAACLQLVNRLVRVLPPRGLRPCLKRSLLLLDLWSRCGLAPSFHLGVRHTADRCEGHAWVTVAGRPDLSASEPGYTEAFLWEGTVQSRP